MDWIAWIAVVMLPPACVLGGGFWYTRRLLRKAERDFPPLGDYVEVEGLRLHYVIQGDVMQGNGAEGRGQGPSVVLLHGAFGALQDFTGPLMDRAAKSWRVIAIDRPGHGYSQRSRAELGTPVVQARLLHGALRKLGVKRPLVAGFSWGGAVALAYALEYPDDTAGVVLLNGAAYPGPGSTEKKYYLPAIPLLGPLLLHTVLMPLVLWLMQPSIAKVFAPGPVVAEFAHSPVPLTVRPASLAANSEDMRLIRPFLAAQGRRYGKLRVPVMALAGEADQVVAPWVHVKPLQAAAPRCEVRILPGVWHQILYTHHDDILQALRRGWELAGQEASAPADRKQA